MIKRLIKAIKKAFADYQSEQKLKRRRQRNKEQLIEIYDGLEKRGY